SRVMRSAMPAGALSAKRWSMKAAPPPDRENASTYLRLSRNVTSSGPALSIGATSRMSRSPSLGFCSRAPLRSASASSENGPARSKKRGSAMESLGGRSGTPALFLLFRGGRLCSGGGGLRRRLVGGHRLLDNIHCQARQPLIELLQHFVGYVECRAEYDQLRPREHQIYFSFFYDFADNVENYRLDLFRCFGVRTLQRLTLGLHGAIILAELSLEVALLLVQRLR